MQKRAQSGNLGSENEIFNPFPESDVSKTNADWKS